MKIQIFLKTGVLKNFANVSGKHLHKHPQRPSGKHLMKCLGKPSGLQPATLLKRDSNTSVFLQKLLRAPFFYRTTPVAAF